MPLVIADFDDFEESLFVEFCFTTGGTFVLVTFANVGLYYNKFMVI